MTSSDEFAEMLAQARELRLLRDVAEAARALHAVLGSDEDPERAALGAALSALDGE